MAAALAAGGAQADKERPFHRPVMTPELNRVSSWVEEFGLDWESPRLAHRTKIRRAHYRTLGHRRPPQAALTEYVRIGLHERHQSHLQWLLIQYVAWAAGSDAALLVQSCSIIASLPRCVIR